MLAPRRQQLASYGLFFCKQKINNLICYLKSNNLLKGERRGSNPRIVESQSTALPLGYARHYNNSYLCFYNIKKK